MQSGCAGGPAGLHLSERIQRRHLDREGNLSQRVALVTGARRGIGRAIAERFIGAGWHVAVNDVVADDLAMTAAELGDRASPHLCDVSEREAVDRMVGEVLETHGRIDALINNAGLIRFDSFLDLAPDDLLEMVAVNVVGALNCTQAVARHWIAEGRGGSVVMVSSISGVRSRPGHGAYGATKAALERLSSVAAVELGVHGIRVNCVVPGGPIRTEFTEAVLGEGLDRRGAERVPLGRVGEPEEVAEVVYFLASERASYVSGASVAVDGALSQGPM